MHQYRGVSGLHFFIAETSARRRLQHFVVPSEQNLDQIGVPVFGGRSIQDMQVVRGFQLQTVGLHESRGIQRDLQR